MIFSLRIDRGSMQIVEHQMIYSPARKKYSHTMMYGYESLITLIYSELIIFSLCWPLILLHYVPNGFHHVYCHVFPISAGFQLTLSPKQGGPGPAPAPFCRPVPGSSGSRQLPVFLSGTRPHVMFFFVF